MATSPKNAGRAAARPALERITHVDAEAVLVTAERDAHCGRQRAREIVAHRRLQRGIAAHDVEVLDHTPGLEVVVHASADPELEPEAVVVLAELTRARGLIDV